MQGRATVDGRVLPAPIYCEHESLRGSAAGKAISSEVRPHPRLWSHACDQILLVV